MRGCLSVLCVFLLVSAFAAVPGRAQQMAITLDDLPYVSPSKTTPQAGLAQVEAVTQALARHGITATGFAVGGQINARSRPALDAFAAAGHQIGNHTWSHPNYDEISLRAFRRELRRTDRVLAPWMTGPKYFRFPYLREGQTDAAKDAAQQALAARGYVNAPVSIDNDEWQFNDRYVQALEAGDTNAAAAIAKAYIAHMQARTRHFQTLARRAVGRDVRHILLLHMNRINADHLGTLLDRFAAQGWQFITLTQALDDPIYAAPDLYAGPRGLSQIERIMGQASD